VLPWICAGVLCASAAFAASEAVEAQQQFSRETASVQADAIALKRAWYGMLGRLVVCPLGRGTNDPCLIFRMSLKGAAYGKDLHFDMARYAGEFLPANAWAPDYSKASHHVEAGALQLKGNIKGGKLKGVLRVNLYSDGSLGEASKPLAGELTIDGTIENGRIGGDYFVTKGFSKANGLLSGTIMTSADTNSAPKDLPVLDPAKLSPGPLYVVTVAIEREAAKVYREIRAMAIAAQYELPYSAATRRAPLRLPVRPSPTVRRDKSGRPIRRKSIPRAGAVTVDAAVDSLFDGLEKDEPPTPPKPRSPRQIASAFTAERLPTMMHIRKHVQRLRECAERALARESMEFASSEESFDDPDFGPWYGFVPLRITRQSVNVLPDGAGGDGGQEWPFVRGWRVLGPFLRTEPLRAGTVNTLPEMVPTADAGFRTRLGKTTAVISWTDVAAAPGSGQVRPWERVRAPAKRVYNKGVWQPAVSFPVDPKVRPGPDVYYYAAGLYASDDVELWLAAGVEGQARLWLNDELLAAWPEKVNPEFLESHTIAKARFRKGLNNITVRVGEPRRWRGADWDSSFWVRICTRGRPAAAEAVKARADAVALKRAEIGERTSRVRGWRGNWRGVFSDEEPVTAWSYRRGINVLWRTRLMPGESTPVVAAGRVFVMMEPNILVCVDADSGRIKWDRECSVLEWNSPEVQRKAHVMYDALRQKWLRLAALGGRTADEIVTALARRDNLGEDEALERLQVLNTAIQDLRTKWWNFVVRNGKLPTSSEPGKHRMPFSFPTPVTDGKLVWAKTGAGVTTCFDVKGRQRWTAKMPSTSSSVGVITSPLLVGDRRDEVRKLVMHLVTGKNIRMAGGFPDEQRLLALNAETGKTVWWSEPVFNTVPASSPLAMTLTNGDEEMDVIVTGGGYAASQSGTYWRDARVPFLAGGSVVRADDGKILIKNLGVSSGWASPVADGDTVYHFDWQCTATRLIMVDRDTVGAKRLWTRRGHSLCSSVAKYDGIIYAQGGGGGFGWYHLFDAATGKRIRHQANVGTHMLGNWAYIPTTIAGGKVFVTDVDWSVGVVNGVPSRIKNFVMQPGPMGRVIARNTLEYPMTAPPIFDGGRIYIRSGRSLTCIGYTGDEGRAYEAEVNFRTLMEDITAEEPVKREPKAIAPVAGIPQSDRRHAVPRTALAGRPVHGDWAFIGPFPLSAAEDARRQLVPNTADVFFTRRSLTVGGKTCKAWWASKPSRNEYQIKRNGRTVFDLLKLTGFESDTVGYFSTVLVSPAARTVRVRQPWPNIEIWIAGTRVEHMDRIRVEKGDYPILVQATVKKAPDELIMDLLFDDSGDEEAEYRRWHESIASNREIFERVIELCPKSKLAKQAKKLLGCVGK